MDKKEISERVLKIKDQILAIDIKRHDLINELDYIRRNCDHEFNTVGRYCEVCGSEETLFDFYNLGDYDTY